MATRELASSGSVATATANAPPENYRRPLAIVTTLFFMWGFLTCLSDILIPHLKSIFDLSYARLMLIQLAFFSAYFLFSIPWSKVVNAIGYQKAMVTGLLCMAAGAFLFLKAASSASLALFLGAVDLLACILASEAGNLALKVLATCGVYLAGGVALRLVKLLHKPRFVETFTRKGCFKDLMERMPIHIITTRTALLGAATFGLQNLSNLKTREQAKACLAPV